MTVRLSGARIVPRALLGKSTRLAMSGLRVDVRTFDYFDFIIDPSRRFVMLSDVADSGRGLVHCLYIVVWLEAFERDYTDEAVASPL